MTRHAILIGCNYNGTEAQLNGCANDVRRMAVEVCAPLEYNMTILLEPGESAPPNTVVAASPTYANIVAAFNDLTARVQPGDSVLIHYSGHGSQQRADRGPNTDKEQDGKDETICPLDYADCGDITDDMLHTLLVVPLQEKRVAFAYIILDCCHSGTGVDLPFVLSTITRSGPALSVDGETDTADISVQETTVSTGETVDVDTYTPVKRTPDPKTVSLTELMIDQAVKLAANHVINAGTEACKALINNFGEQHHSVSRFTSALRFLRSHVLTNNGNGPVSIPLKSKTQTAAANQDSTKPVKKKVVILPKPSAPIIISISGCRDDQTSADAEFSSVSSGALTYSLLAILKPIVRGVKKDILASELIRNLHLFMISNGFSQRPIISSNVSGTAQLRLTFK